MLEVRSPRLGAVPAVSYGSEYVPRHLRPVLLSS